MTKRNSEKHKAEMEKRRKRQLSRTSDAPTDADIEERKRNCTGEMK